MMLLAIFTTYCITLIFYTVYKVNQYENDIRKELEEENKKYQDALRSFIDAYSEVNSKKDESK